MIVRIGRDGRGWYFVRLTFPECPHTTVRAAMGYTLAAAVQSFRHGRKVAELAATASRGLGEVYE